MKRSFEKVLDGYNKFKSIYKNDDGSLMNQLATEGQSPEVMVVSCCDSRVDPSMILQCKPGDLFVARNVANIIPPYENDEFHHGTSAALEFGICYLKVKHLIIWGHSQCGGISALLNEETLKDQNDFIGNWIDIIKKNSDFDIDNCEDVDVMAKASLSLSYNNCLSFPWIKSKVENNELQIHRWFFDIKHAQVYQYNENKGDFEPLQ